MDDIKFYTMIVTIDKTGMPTMAHLLSGTLNSVFDAEFPTIPIQAKSDEDAMNKANQIIEKQKAKILEYIVQNR